MPTPVPQGNEFSNVNFPLDGEVASAGALMVLAATPLANRSVNLQDLISTLTYNTPGLSSSYPIHIDIDNGIAVASKTVQLTKNADSGTGRVYWYQGGITDGGLLLFRISGYLPRTGRVSSVSIGVIGSAHTNMPNAKPQVSLVRVPILSAVNTAMGVIETAIDPTSNVTAYALPHWITLTSATPHQIDPAYDYFIAAEGEYAAESLAGLEIVAAKFTVIQ